LKRHATTLIALFTVFGTLDAFGQEPPAPTVAPPWYANTPVADVRLLAPRGGLPEESLEPLLRSEQGQPLDVQEIRLDLATLFRVGEFSAVEADLEPWVLYDDDGNLVPAALLTYVVYPAPKISRIRVEGTDLVRERDVLDAIRIGVGAVFYGELESTSLRARVLEDLRRRGFPDAEVEVFTVFTEEEGSVEVRIVVHEGEPVTVDAIAFAGDLPVPERKLRRWLKREGVKEGAPLSTEAVTRAQFAVKEQLARLGGLLREERGWVEARVTPAITGDGQGGTLVTFTVEPGPRLVLEVDGLGWRPEWQVREGMGIDERVRLTRGFLEAAPDRMEAWLQRRGFYAAEVEVALEEDSERRFQVLRTTIERGPRHILHRVDFEGNEVVDDEELRNVMDQASDEVIRLNRVTGPELEQAVSAVADVYRSRGYLDVEAELVTVQVTGRLRELTESGRAPLGRTITRPLTPGAMFVVPHVQIREGPLTVLVALDIKGEAPRVNLRLAEERGEELVGGPYSPQALEALTREVVEAHRRDGFLEADARVLRHPADEGEMSAIIAVETGPLVRLRSVVSRGARITRPRTIRREVEFELGQPVSSSELERLRRSLYDLGIFRTVDTDLLGDEEARDLVISVRERPVWAFELGGGVATDQGIRSYGRVTRRNLWGQAHRLDLYALLGFDWRGSAITDWTPDLAAPEWRAAISYTAPRFPIRRQRVVLDILLRELLQERTWQMSKSGAGIAVETWLGDQTGLRSGLKLESRRLAEFDAGALLPGEPWAALTDPDDPGRATGGRWVGSVYTLMLHDLRDDPLQPTRGLIVSVLGEWSPRIGDPDLAVSFLKGEARTSAYLPVGGPILHMSGEVARAWVLGSGILALEDRYQLGGTGSLRGYKRDAIGPRNLAEQFTTDWPDQLGPAVNYWTRDNPTRWVPTGGDLRAVVVGELILPFPWLGFRAWDGYAAALFADFGNVWLVGREARDLATSDQETWRDVFHPLARYSVGAGMRVVTPVGPLQADLAVNPEAIRAEGPKKDLLRDAWREPTIRFHLSLGAL
jgi:outer membrane protein assembly factor BamA